MPTIEMLQMISGNKRSTLCYRQRPLLFDVSTGTIIGFPYIEIGLENAADI
jgi:hypothetical protein